MSRKIISLFVSLMLLFTCLLPVNIFAATGNENLVFEMAFSSDSSGNDTVVNGVSGGNSTVTVSGSPAWGQINNNKYLSFSGNARVKVEDSDFINQNEMTFETWIKGSNFGASDTTNSYRLAVMATGMAESNWRYDIYGSTNDIFYRPGGPKGTSLTAPNPLVNAPDTRYNDKLADYDEKWCHYVFTRKWTPTQGAAVGQGRWSGELYVNGVKITPNYTNDNNDQLRCDETNLYMLIGNNGYYSAPFLGSIATFKVYNSILDAATIAAKYNAEKNNFITYADTLVLEDISESDNTISDAAGEITLKFNNYLDTSTLKNGITFTKADGTEIKGGAYVTPKDDFTNEAVIRFGALELNGEYCLNITSDLKSVNNKSFSGNGTYPYTAVKEYIFYDDFKGTEYTVGGNPPTDGSIEYTSSNEVDDASNITVCGDDSFRYISMNGGGTVNQNSRIKLVLDTPVTEDVFAVDVKLRPASSNGAANDDTPRNVMTVAGTSASVQLANMRYGFVEANTAPGAIATLVGDIDFNVTDARGFYNLNAVFEKNSTGNYVVTLKNANAPTEGKAVYTTKNISDVKAIEISHLYPLNDSQATNVTADVACIAVYKMTAPEILYTNFGELDRNDDTIKIVYNDDLDESTLDASAFSLVAADGSYVNTEYMGYNSATRTVTLKLRDYLDSSAVYKLCTEEIASESGLTSAAGEHLYASKADDVETSSIKAYNEAGTEIQSLDNISEFKGSVSVDNNGTGNKTCVVALVLYDANGRIIKLIKNNPVDGTVNSGTDKTISAEAGSSDLSGVDKIKMLAWIEDENGAVSLIKPVVLEKSN